MMDKKPWDERTQQGIDEVQAVIKAAFPEAEFRAHRGVIQEEFTSTRRQRLIMGLTFSISSVTVWWISVSRNGWASI
jgi:hypothetical protein